MTGNNFHLSAASFHVHFYSIEGEIQEKNVFLVDDKSVSN